jgi:hypothetical protein
VFYLRNPPGSTLQPHTRSRTGSVSRRGLLASCLHAAHSPECRYLPRGVQTVLARSSGLYRVLDAPLAPHAQKMYAWISTWISMVHGDRVACAHAVPWRVCLARHVRLLHALCTCVRCAAPLRRLREQPCIMDRTRREGTRSEARRLQHHRHPSLHPSRQPYRWRRTVVLGACKYGVLVGSHAKCQIFRVDKTVPALGALCRASKHAECVYRSNVTGGCSDDGDGLAGERA